MVTELISKHTPVTVRQQFHARSIVETSIATVTVRVCDCERPGDPVIEIASGGNPWGEAPASGNPPYLLAYFSRTRDLWKLESCTIRYADALVVTDGDAAKEQRDWRRKFGIKTNVKVLASRSPLRQEIVDLATKWATEHPEQLKQEDKSAFLDGFDYWLECVKEALEKMREAHQHIRPTLLAAERVGLITPTTRADTDKAVKALESCNLSSDGS